MPLPRTIDEAELHGWTWLRSTCPKCGKTVDIPWGMLRRRTPIRTLTAVARALVCDRCGVAPSSVALARQIANRHGHPDYELAEIG